MNSLSPSPRNAESTGDEWRYFDQTGRYVTNEWPILEQFMGSAAHFCFSSTQNVIVQAVFKWRLAFRKTNKIPTIKPTGTLQWLANHPTWPMSGVTLSSVSNTSPAQRASHPHPPDFHADLWGIPWDHLCGNFLMISLRKWRGNEGEFSMRIFPPPFPVESLGIFPRGNFPRASLKNFKMQFNDIGRVPVMWKYPSDDLMSFFGELKCFQVWGNFPLISTPI